MRYAWIQRHCDEFAVARLCRCLKVSRTGYCQWIARKPSDRAQRNADLDARIAVLHAQFDRIYGHPRLCLELHAQGLRTSHERVRKSLIRQQLFTRYRRRYRVTTNSNHKHPVAQNVLDRRFNGWEINQAWVGDITCIQTAEGWLYLASIMDLASRRIVGWSMDHRMNAGLVCAALKMAYGKRKPKDGLIMHTDRGIQYASKEYCQLISKYKMTQSMSRKGNCWDNAVMESFFKTLKVERVSGMNYETREQAKGDLVNWIEYHYNRNRRHSAIEQQTPVAFEGERIRSRVGVR